MKNIPFSLVALFALAATCAFLGGYVMMVMHAEVNRKLPNEDQISYLWGHYAKFERVLREYKRFYPKGRLDWAFKILFVLMFLLGAAAMVLLVYISPG